MILRRVSIEGFKGISNRVELEISPTLTVIFGPNFYGKSSILEAIQWCLYCNSGAEWRQIKRVFEDSELVNVRKTKAIVSIDYEHSGETYTMFAETKSEEGYGFKSYDHGSFKNLTLGELKFTDFITVITTTQTRRFVSKEDLKALDLAFNVTFWRELANKSENVAKDLLDIEKKIAERVYSWRTEIEKIYTNIIKNYEEIKSKVKDISIESIRKELSELLNRKIDEVPTALEDLIEFIKKVGEPYISEIEKLEKEREGKVEKIKSAKLKIEQKIERINKIEKILPEIKSRTEELSKLTPKESLIKDKRRLERKISEFGELIKKLDEEKRRVEENKLRLERQLNNLSELYKRVLSLTEELQKTENKLKDYEEENLDHKWRTLRSELERLEEQEKELENELGKTLEIIEIIERALPLMKEDVCAVCEADKGKTRAEKKLNNLKSNHRKICEELEKVRREANGLKKELESLEEKIKEKERLRSEASGLKQQIRKELGNYGFENIEDLNGKITELEEEINNLIQKANDLKKQIESKENERHKAIDDLREINSEIIKIENLESEIKGKLAEAGIDTWKLSINEITSKINELEKEKEDLRKKVEGLKSELRESEKELQAIEKEIKLLEEKRKEFSEKKKDIRRKLELLSEFERLENLRKEIELIIRGAIKLFEELEEVLSGIEERRLFFLKLYQSTNSFIGELIEDELDKLNKLIDVFFKALYDHPEFKDIRIKFDPNSKIGYKVEVIDTKGETYGEEIFSTSGKDMARLAISSACSFYGLRKGEFNLLIIDEPQQHLDFKHKEKFARDFLTKICEKCQVVLATVDKELWNLIRRYAPEGAIFYEIINWTLENGPEIRRV